MRSDHPLDRYDEPEGRRWGARTATIAVVLAAIVPLAFAGWLGWRAIAGSGSGTATAAAAAPVPGSGVPGSGVPGSSVDGLGASPSHAGSGTPSAPASASAAPSTSAPGAATAAPANGAHPLAGKTIVIDPGHNPDNGNYPSEINALVNIGNGTTNCDTTGTETNAGYLEANFTLDVAHRLRALLQAEGATVVLTQDGNRPWGPCVTERAAIGNAAHADAAISIHGDGAGASDRGFHVILPQTVVAGRADTRPIVGPSRTLGMDIRSAFTTATGEPFANYINGGLGYDVRGDLGGLNMSTVPKVFIECGNMRNSTDAAEMTNPAWRQQAAQGLANGFTAFLAQTH
ncbi:N-acetylmuramoyl-L-alanine amidase [Streptacidiphilus sp. EB129]|uniref:N-acetylmuramoyl-L-alanine amidase n=1 Tax=Streptacidiphilus sp. EB129 TaxID=3156262 RepID=UPI0035130867